MSNSHLTSFLSSFTIKTSISTQPQFKLTYQNTSTQSPYNLSSANSPPVNHRRWEFSASELESKHETCRDKVCSKIFIVSEFDPAWVKLNCKQCRITLVTRCYTVIALYGLIRRINAFLSTIYTFTGFACGFAARILVIAFKWINPDGQQSGSEV